MPRVISSIHVPYNAPLNVNDNEEQTFGCRATSPSICKNFGLANCAFKNPNKICSLPPRGWKKHYLVLKGE